MGTKYKNMVANVQKAKLDAAPAAKTPTPRVTPTSQQNLPANAPALAAKAPTPTPRPSVPQQNLRANAPAPAAKAPTPTPRPSVPQQNLPANAPALWSASHPKTPTPTPRPSVPMGGVMATGLGARGFMNGGAVKSSVSSRGDGCATKGKTKGRFV